MSEQNEEAKVTQLGRILESRAENGRIDCRAALETANELGVSPDVIGKMLNKLGIKVAHCQLGCF